MHPMKRKWLCKEMVTTPHSALLETSLYLQRQNEIATLSKTHSAAKTVYCNLIFICFEMKLSLLHFRFFSLMKHPESLCCLPSTNFRSLLKHPDFCKIIFIQEPEPELAELPSRFGRRNKDELITLIRQSLKCVMSALCYDVLSIS